jgi:hypothetical protein
LLYNIRRRAVHKQVVLRNSNNNKRWSKMRNALTVDDCKL